MLDILQRSTDRPVLEGEMALVKMNLCFGQRQDKWPTGDDVLSSCRATYIKAFGLFQCVSSAFAPSSSFSLNLFPSVLYLVTFLSLSSSFLPSLPLWPPFSHHLHPYLHPFFSLLPLGTFSRRELLWPPDG